MRISQTFNMKRIVLTVMLSVCSAMLVMAQQDKKVDININSKSDSAWYTSPVVWIIGAAIFILLLVALLRGGRRD